MPSQEMISIPKDKLFYWHSTVMTQKLFPGMESKIGKLQYRDLAQVLREMEEIIGVRRDQPDFEGG